MSSVCKQPCLMCSDFGWSHLRQGLSSPFAISFLPHISRATCLARFLARFNSLGVRRVLDEISR
jgi:hypothetical protein